MNKIPVIHLKVSAVHITVDGICHNKQHRKEGQKIDLEQMQHI